MSLLASVPHLLAAEGGGGLQFPTIDELVKWPYLGPINKIILIDIIAVILTAGIFLLGRKKALVPRGMQNLSETSVDFIDNGILQQAIGHGAEKYLPFIASIFFFVLFGNIFEVIPVIAMPANARMANPAFLGILTWVFFICAGIRAQGLRYFKNALFPPGVPKALYILVTPIEFISTFIVRPFSLAVRLFANMLAGHILLVTFAVLTITLLYADAAWLKVLSILPFAMQIAVTGFEVMVAFLQAYVFAILAAVFIGLSIHDEH